MPEVVVYICILILLFFLELLFFGIADHFSIIDKPNHRSSHSTITIRGGGVIFVVACLLWFFYSGFNHPFFIAGMAMIALISFVDDVSALKSGTRSLVHFFAVSLLLVELGADIDWYWFPLLLIMISGTINAYNFMDGINGITGAYSLITLFTLFVINHSIEPFTSESLLIFLMLSVLVFNLFNFRGKAKCFAGDVGSVSMAFIICFLLAQLIVQTKNVLFIGLLLVYGLDAVTTIAFRLIRRENIFEAHRSHFYQFLANEKKWPHLRVASVYAILQAALNAIIIVSYQTRHGFVVSLVYLLIALVASAVLFLTLRIALEGRKRLFKPSSDLSPE